MASTIKMINQGIEKQKTEYYAEIRKSNEKKLKAIKEKEIETK
ncbi:hypothetical protein [Aquibacillus albus]|uniref:FbpB family small basic protein n=1 Tax=Aquibacillus albus TaxID=1168171 RepID=A0ABS2N3M2_9BACI|nr:hypothetical protein [Aquibacillus albus]MBM7572704.1 hypothetical protein [Aquibacillus albus]